MIKVGIIGNGYVGSATQLIKAPEIEYKVYDVDESRCSEGVNKAEDLQGCDFIFLCLPTPMNEDGSCHTDLLENVIKELKSWDSTPDLIVRSTVPVGFCREQGVSFMPEFLTEKNWVEDVKNCSSWVFGVRGIEHCAVEGGNLDDALDKVGTNSLITHLRVWIQYAAKAGSVIEDSTLDFVTTDLAELAKLTRNVFLAVKVSFFNEISEFCEHNEMNYQALRPLVAKDPRIGDSHTKVPGPDGKHGYGGTCFPKDISSLVYQMKNTDKMQLYVTEAAMNRNLERDRPDHDWKESKGRAVV